MIKINMSTSDWKVIWYPLLDIIIKGVRGDSMNIGNVSIMF